MSCKPNSWFYGNCGSGITGTRYGTLTRIKTPSSLPSITCTVAYFVSCRSTNLDSEGKHRFYQATIAYTPSAGYWHFSWGYSPDHLGQPPYTGLIPVVNHDYELGIKFTGSVVQAFVRDLPIGTNYTMGSFADNGTMWLGDQPGFIMEGFTDNISEMNVSAFKAYTFNYFLTPTSSMEWPHGQVFRGDPKDYSIPSQIHTYHQGSHQYLIGKTTLGSQLANGTFLW
jgi:hypothetical protein